MTVSPLKQKPKAAPSWPADRVERRAVDELIPYARNARTHSDAQVAQLAASIVEWGWTMPVRCDGTCIGITRYRKRWGRMEGRHMTAQLMDNIVSIGSAQSLLPGEPSLAVIDLLNQWLDMATRGEIVQVLIAGVKPVRGTITEWAGVATGDQALAAATALQARVTAAWLAANGE